jgi:hypothetical protein
MWRDRREGRVEIEVRSLLVKVQKQRDQSILGYPKT